MNLHLIDVGSTSIKYACWTRGVKGPVKAVPFPEPLPGPAFQYEVDPRQIMKAIHTVMTHVDSGDQILISVQMHGYLLADAEDHLLTPYISWRDRRSEMIEDCRRYPFEMPAWCGVSAKPNLPLAGLNAIRMTQPELYHKVRTFYTLGTFITHQLTGENVGHITDLAPTGAYDSRTGIVRDLSIIRDIDFPKAVEVMPVGRFHGADVWPAVGDQQASVAGSGLSENQYLLNLGTAAQVCTLTEETVYGDYESRPFFEGKTLCTITGLTGGRDYPLFSTDDKQAVRKLVDEYGNALKRLPSRESLLAVGGVCRHYRSLVETILEQMKLPWIINGEVDALDGLIRVFERNVN